MSRRLVRPDANRTTKEEQAMTINRYTEREDLTAALAKGDPLLAVIPFDGSAAWIAHVDECVEHHILLTKAGISSAKTDRYFRIVFDKDAADWTFVCPPDYKNIEDKARRIAAFYRDGFAAISAFLAELELPVDVRIPQRYRRHMDALGDAPQ